MLTLREFFSNLWAEPEALKIKRAAGLSAWPVTNVPGCKCGSYGVYNKEDKTFDLYGDIFDRRWVSQGEGGEVTTSEYRDLEVGLSTAASRGLDGTASKVKLKVGADWKLKYHLKAKVREASFTHLDNLLNALKRNACGEGPDGDMGANDMNTSRHARGGELHIVVGVWKGPFLLLKNLHSKQTMEFVADVNDLASIRLGFQNEQRGNEGMMKSDHDEVLFVKMVKVTNGRILSLLSAAEYPHHLRLADPLARYIEPDGKDFPMYASMDYININEMIEDVEAVEPSDVVVTSTDNDNKRFRDTDSTS